MKQMTHLHPVLGLRVLGVIPPLLHLFHGVVLTSVQEYLYLVLIHSTDEH